jgi:hypothetical protein
MKKLIVTLFGAALAFTLSSAQAEEKTFEGEMSCEKCHLKQAEACGDTLKVGETVYLLEEAGDRKTSEHVCDGTAKAKVTGKVEERDGKKVIVVSKIVVE